MRKRQIFLLLFFGVTVFNIILFLQTKKLQMEIKGAKTSLVIIPTITLTLTPTPTLSPTPTLMPTPTATPSPTLAPIIILPKDLDDLFTKYSDEYSVDKELLKKIANCESSLNPNSATDLYAGLFQFAEPIWIQTRNLIGLNPDVNLRFNAEESIRTAAFMVSQGHLGIWPNCGR
jgi:hypothetical protein